MEITKRASSVDAEGEKYLNELKKITYNIVYFGRTVSRMDTLEELISKCETKNIPKELQDEYMAKGRRAGLDDLYFDEEYD